MNNNYWKMDINNQEELTSIIENLNKEKKYRPTAVALICKENNLSEIMEYLVVQSSNNPNNWYFPQGGIEENETLKKTLIRELDEELDIDYQKEIISIKLNFYFETLVSEDKRLKRDDFEIGKGYIFSLLKYNGQNDFKFKDKELSDAKFLNYNDALKQFKNTRSEKKEMMKRALDKAVGLLGGNLIKDETEMLRIQYKIKK